ncbi:response regulator [Thermosediminibacter oceani]|uniref:Stage 0 sporulation protein A homolog n=1 Tax=Thermosediminibacter oceani (strain ATCC BAA-1034 / DSM 16646 / JW/IW-1228P) TaxID=555079 RepID=D9S0Y7_THEOJ|nr:response regulator transcription factor [Thermosediminibacter oceani]ADL07151.1 two component transcriptional regulator, LuxR family [Thermosediminibacter oceani DSM 16646]
MSKISVVLADDHVLVRKGLKKILEMESDIEVVGEASNGLEAVEEVRTKAPDVVLMDINMPKLNGVEATRVLKKESLKTKVIILTIYDDREYLLELLKTGISGYILKDIDPQALVEAVRAVSRGETYIQPTLTRALIAEYNRLSQPISRASRPLTAREKEVMAYIAEGMSNIEISEKLGISEKTVKNHVSSILRKLNLMDRTQVAVYALKNNLV